MERGCGSSLSLDGLRTLFLRWAMDRRPSLAEGYSLGHRLFAIPHPSAYLRRPELEASQIGVLSLARRLRGVLCVWRCRQMNCRVRRLPFVTPLTKSPALRGAVRNLQRTTAKKEKRGGTGAVPQSVRSGAAQNA